MLLNIDRIVRCILAYQVENKGQTQFFIPKDMPLEAPWQHYNLHSHYEDDRDGWVITVTDRTRGTRRSEFRNPEPIPEADFEIVDEKPVSPPQLSSGSDAPSDS